MAERKTILIGAEYKDTYESLVKILSSGSLENTIAHVEKGVDGKPIICTDSALYVYGGGAGSAAGDSVNLAMQRDGASWFAPVRRGKAFDDGMSEWRRLIERVAGDFHKHFSIIEYRQCGGSGEVDVKATEDRIAKLIGRLFERRDVSFIKGGDKNKGTEDIYGASVKLELSGTGQAHFVVMCKIYFRRTAENGVLPLTSAEAAQINARLEAAEDNTDPISLTEEESNNINTTTVTAVKDLIAGSYPVNFKQCLCFSEKQVANRETGVSEDNFDLKTYKYLAKRAVTNNAPVTCTSVKVLGISHVRWINDYYEVAFGGKTCLKVLVGFGGSLSVTCANCNGGNIVTSNMIIYSYTDKDGVKHDEHVNIDYTADNLGIDDKKLDEIRRYSELKNHLFTVSCKNPRLEIPCVSCVCASQAVRVGGVIRCADCPYPEVVYTDYSGDRPFKYLTGRMTFVHDRLSMALKEDASDCERCGRRFTADSLVNGQCRLCASIGNLAGEELAQAKKLYSKYANMFPHSVRLKHVFDKKYCVEDETAMVFALGFDTYVLSKSELKSDGFVTGPVKK